MRPKRIFLVHQQRSANRVFQFLLAIALQKKVPGATLHGYDLDIFGLRDPDPLPEYSRRHIVIEAHNDLHLDRLAFLLNSNVADSVSLQVYGHRLEYLPSPAAARSILNLSQDPQLQPDDSLVIHIRAEDIFTNPHPDYRPLPLQYYRQILDHTGLNPVFLGQLDTPFYTAALRQMFPKAIFRPQATPLADFTFLMQSKNIALSVSTFAWIAAWLSPVAKQIILPVAGIFNPAQRPDVDLLPNKDPRYVYYSFPLLKWRASPTQRTELLTSPFNATELTTSQILDMKTTTLQQANLLSGLRPAKNRGPFKRFGLGN